MAIVDVEKIINGTPIKRFFNAYEAMKENYNEETAKVFYSFLSSLPTSMVLENSRYIFSEPMYGYEFYRRLIFDPCFVNFTSLEIEHEKVLNFLNENGSKMGDHQKELYVTLEEKMNQLIQKTKNIRAIAEYLNTKYDHLEAKLSDSDNPQNVILETNDPIVNILYAPFVGLSEELYNALLDQSGISDELKKLPNSLEKWRNYVDTCIAAKCLYQDELYQDRISSENRKYRALYDYFADQDVMKSLDDFITVKEKTPFTYESAELAINNLFIMTEMSDLYKDEDAQEKKMNESAREIVEASTMNFLTACYQSYESTEDLAEGFDLLDSEIDHPVSVEEGMNYMITHYPFLGEFTEAVEEDSDEEIDKLEKDVVGKPNDPNTITKPKEKNLATKIQHSAMDKEAKQMKKSAIRKQKAQEILNAGKAVIQLPMNVVKSIGDVVGKIGKMDDKRRKDYIKEPGFRKKIFRNLKLAILYGTAAQIKLALVPVTMVIRHFSKDKNIRIRNELVRELNTEIKITDSKIEDANSADDKKEKYRLMRIRDELEAEMLRVKTNSKYI